MTPEERALLADLAEKFWAAAPAEFSGAWNSAVALGLPLLLAAEDRGGSGGVWSDLFTVQRAAGRYASSLPLGEAAAAIWLCQRAKFTSRDGFGTIAGQMTGSLSNGRYTGTLARVPGASDAEWVVGLDGSGALIRVSTAGARLEPRYNIAGEDRGSWHVVDADCDVASCDLDTALLLALVRLGNIAGALEAALLMTSEHVRTRIQFGKPIARFQVVQQQIALFASDVGAASCAAQAACASADRDGAEAAQFAIGAAKLRANLAIENGAAIAHQLHGAIGFTQEHRLHRYTKRLWAWRSEGGTDRFWSRRLGAAISGRGAARLWPDIVDA